LDFLTGRLQVVRVGNNTSAMLILNTGALEGCVLSPLLYSLFTHDCVAKHNSNTIIKFADDTTMVGLINIFKIDFKTRFLLECSLYRHLLMDHFKIGN
jgi:hypothetical protein